MKKKYQVASIYVISWKLKWKLEFDLYFVSIYNYKIYRRITMTD